MNKDWIERYWDYIVKANYEKAIPLKLQNFPESFFKYRTLTRKSLETIEESYIWLADIASLNDPFECSIQFDNDECLRHFYSSEQFQKTFKLRTGQILTQKEIKQLSSSKNPYNDYLKICLHKNIIINESSEEQLKKVQTRWSQIVNETNSKLRICSFSLINSSLLLWAHYAGEHKGISIEYDFRDSDIIRPFMQPIIYRNQVHKIGLFEEYDTMQMIGASLIKSEDWAYEQEWRLTIFKQKDIFPQKITAPTPKAIYLGTRFSSNEKELKEQLFTLALDRNIPIYQMAKDPQEFKLIKEGSTVAASI